ncbi:MAG: hypothetical protein LVQ95_01790 [Candidatus Micrarchaeales archaeon]|nr:hypothetical protein [Candidatus Micrarchaeales archaeon]
MENQIEVILSLTIIILAILAIVVYLYSGANAAFYGIFVVALVIMFYTWRRTSMSPLPASHAPEVRRRRSVPRRKRTGKSAGRKARA